MKPFEMETDRMVDELRTEMRAGTKRLFWFYMTLGVTNAAIIIGMLGLLR